MKWRVFQFLCDPPRLSSLPCPASVTEWRNGGMLYKRHRPGADLHGSVGHANQLWRHLAHLKAAALGLGPDELQPASACQSCSLFGQLPTTKGPHKIERVRKVRQ